MPRRKTLSVAALFILTASAAAQEPNPIVSVGSLAELKALSSKGSSFGQVSARGYYPNSNIGGGLFSWQNPSSENGKCKNDNGVVVAVDNLSNARGCWVRHVEGNVYRASWFGAKASNSLADKVVNTAALQNLMNAAQATNHRMELDICGRYYISDTLRAPLDRNTYPTQPFQISGCGASIAYDLDELSQGSIIAMDPAVDKPILQYTDWTKHFASGNIQIGFIRWEGCSSTRVLYFQVLTGSSAFHNNEVVQHCKGNGLDIDQSAITASVTNNTFVGSTFRDATAMRYGTGLSVRPAINGGLFKIIGNTSRGWEAGYSIGGGAGMMIAPLLEHNESSLNTFGFRINADTQGALLYGNYSEGGGNTVIIDCGDRTKIRDSWIYGGFLKAIDNAKCETRGNIYSGNYIETAGSADNGKPSPIIMIDIKSNGEPRSGGKSVVENTLSYAGKNPGVIGIRISGGHPDVNLLPTNHFEPRGWAGVGTLQIDCVGKALRSNEQCNP